MLGSFNIVQRRYQPGRWSPKRKDGRVDGRILATHVL